VFPSGPGDACQAVGERHGRDVVSALTFALHSPLPELIQGTPGTLLSMHASNAERASWISRVRK
jgi:hypothetical protein